MKLLSVPRDTAMGFVIPAALLARFSQKHGKTTGETTGLFQSMKQYLLTAKEGTEPSAEVDEMWHEFILFTKEYAAFCDLAGGFIHHNPKPLAGHCDFSVEAKGHCDFSVETKALCDVGPDNAKGHCDFSIEERGRLCDKTQQIAV
jgi:hypothetical protein